ncbi:hypothetical protein, partial [Cupriavidus gilardii]
WAALTQRLSGFQSGVAQSAQLNKAWRQSSIMAAVIAGFVADVTGRDVIDDGTTDTILTNLKAAVSAQSPVVVGSARNLTGSAAVGATTANFTAAELVCESALNALRYCIPNFNATLNLTNVGVNGMDAGQAPASGSVAIYAIYNPTTKASGLLAQTMPGVASEVYSGASMPAGFTASALISVVTTNASRQFNGFVQRDRFIGFAGIGVLGTTAAGGNAFNAHNIGGAVPANAKTYSGYANANATGASAVNIAVAANAAGMANQTANMSGSSNGGPITWKDVPLTTAQTAYFYYNAPGATAQNYSFYISGYTI